MSARLWFGVSVALFVVGTPLAASALFSPIIGGGRDAYGCLGSGGYRWCQKERKCVRSWELSKKRGIAQGRVAAYCGRARPPSRPVGGDTDVHGCKGSAGYRWCARESKCVRFWELASKRRIDASRVAAYCATRGRR
jgi:hypothetical protein